MSKPDALSVSAIEGGLQFCGLRLQVLDGGIGTPRRSWSTPRTATEISNIFG
jgi:hypothetical protein